MSKTDGGPAFPVIAENGLGHVSDGMSLRDYFAAAAITGLLATPNPPAINGVPIELDSAAYKIADAMLRARES